jgi:hypothetical protein
MRFTVILLAVGLFATGAGAQNWDTSDPGSAPGVSSTGGLPRGPVNRADTSDPGSAPGVSSTGGRPLAVNPAEVRRMDTSDPNSTPQRF